MSVPVGILLILASLPAERDPAPECGCAALLPATAAPGSRRRSMPGQLARFVFAASTFASQL